jgi:hypothetical protein
MPPMTMSGAMRTALSTILISILAIAVTLMVADNAVARTKKPRHRSHGAPSITRDYDGTPIIMRDLERPKKQAPEDGPVTQSRRPVHIPHGSGGYIPPPVPSPYASPPPPLTQPPGVYKPPPINSFGDRVIDAIHAYPLEKGIGNNPTDPQMFIRQRANQP